MATNNSPAGVPCSLHGGRVGFDKKLWSGRPVDRPSASGVELAYTSPDGEEGYPGTLRVKVTYWLTERDELEIQFEATTDKPSVVNLTNHTYWNLTGDPRRGRSGPPPLAGLEGNAARQCGPDSDWEDRGGRRHAL